MKKLLVVAMLIVGLLATGIVSAQDDEATLPTIGEIVVTSAEAEEAEFTTLLAAVQAADEFVLEALVDPEQDITVFAPTDAAFEALVEALGEDAFGELLEDTDAMTEILLYHVIEGAAMSSDVVAFLEENENEFSVPTLSDQRVTIAGDLEEGITVNDANLVLEMVDIEASNGIVHVIDAVLVPELDTIAEIVVASTEAEEAEFTTLLTAVGAADEAVLEALSDPSAALTVFAPTDAAFAALVEALGEDAFGEILEDTEALTDILLYHVLEAVIYEEDLVALLEAFEGEIEGPAFNGDIVVITSSEEGVFINDAQIVVTDVVASNGIVHVIDAVLVPPADEEMEATEETEETEDE